MGEIRSTLDIIMEKTKGLTMSDEEKKAFKEQEMAGKVKGLIQKYLDGTLNMDQLRVEVTGLVEKGGDMVKRLIREESVSRIELEGNNEPLLRVLGEISGSEADSLREVLKEFGKRLEREKDVREKELRKELEKQGISGSAVLPSINADPEWSRYVLEIREEFQERLTSRY
ncbi:MAG: hypothetical protein PVJ69_16710 [Desulfobacteraceae bacterium]|jgi:hypothetical protein